MPKLNQIIAVVQGKKTRTQQLLTDLHRFWTKDNVSGITKQYESLTEEGEKLPGESKHIQVNVKQKLKEITEHLADFYNVVATQDAANTFAKSDVVIENNKVLENVPVTVLLFLEKQLEDLKTFVSNLPTLPEDREWKKDPNRDCFITDPVRTVRTQKVPKVIVKSDATKEHPAQTELIYQDNAVGTWTTIHLSSALPQKEKNDMLQRVLSLQDAVKMARENANSVEAPTQSVGEKILNFVFGAK